jgi:hypothetical protein
VEEVYTGVLNDAFRGGLAHSRHTVTRVCVFCGSSAGVRPEYADAARALAPSSPAAASDSSTAAAPSASWASWPTPPWLPAWRSSA